MAEDGFSVGLAKLIDVHDGDLIINGSKTGRAYGHTSMASHGTDNVAWQKDKLEVV